MLRGVRSSLRLKLLAAHLLVVVVGVVTLVLAMGLTATAVFDRLMVDAMGPQMQALGHTMTQDAGTAMAELTARAFRQAVATSLTWAASAAAITAIVVSFLVSGPIARPVLRMVLASRRIAAGRYAERVPEGGQDELGQLAASFNEMAGTLEDVERHRRELIGDVAHELRTPIANLQGYVEGLVDGVVQPSAETWAFLLGETVRLRRLVEDLQELSRAEARQLSINPNPIAPDRLASLAVARLGPEFAEKGLTLANTVGSRLPNVLADEDRVVQVLGNLLSNALRYTPEGGRVELSAERQEREIVFRVRDTGIGVVSESLPHLFERFYRTDRARTRAAGDRHRAHHSPGVSVEAMGGRIWAESPGPGQGSTFSFTLPLAL